MRLWPFFLGLPSLISYVPGTGPQALFGDASLSICQKTSCEPESIEVIETSAFKADIFALPSCCLHLRFDLEIGL